MTTAVCKRASRCCPSEPSESAQQLAEYLVSQAEADLRSQGFERQVLEELQVFKHQAASTGKGPAVRADTGDADNDAAAQAMMNHMVSIKSRHVDTNNQEPPWLMDTERVSVTYDAGRQRNQKQVNSSVTKRSSTGRCESN